MLRADLYSEGIGVWEVEVREIDGAGRRIQSRYTTETEARDAMEAAYAYGRQHGMWHIDRAPGYQPSSEIARQN